MKHPSEAGRPDLPTAAALHPPPGQREGAGVPHGNTGPATTDASSAERAAHQCGDPRQIVRIAELDDDPSLALPHLNPDPGVKGVGQALRHLMRHGIRCRLPSGWPRSGRLLPAASSTDSSVARRPEQPFGDDSRRKILLLPRVFQSEDARACPARARQPPLAAARFHRRLSNRMVFVTTDNCGRVGPRVRRASRRLDQSESLVGRSLLQRIELDAVDILHTRRAGDIVASPPDDREIRSARRAATRASAARP